MFYSAYILKSWSGLPPPRVPWPHQQGSPTRRNTKLPKIKTLHFLTIQKAKIPKSIYPPESIHAHFCHDMMDQGCHGTPCTFPATFPNIDFRVVFDLLLVLFWCPWLSPCGPSKPTFPALRFYVFFMIFGTPREEGVINVCGAPTPC